ncbi:hypothetical protein BASA83_009300 [Batrachochytrium salamandrivorans]|nr:hypothetical protein BASA83_009300 [Batrachochytrium salamandrivorans]
MFVPALTLILALVSSAVIAAPMVDNVYKRAVASLGPSSTKLPFHFPESVYEHIAYSGAAPSPSSEEDDAKTAIDYICKKLDLGESDFKVSNSLTDSAGVTHVYGVHMINDIRVANHKASVHAKNGQVTYFSSSFGTDQHFSKSELVVSAAKATVDFERASDTASTQLGIPVYSKFEHTFEYVEQPDGKIVYAYKFQLRNNPTTKWVEVWCDATTGRVIQAINFAKKASYRAIPLPRRDATEGFAVVTKPEFKRSSPNGWTDGKATEGNNIITKTPRGNTTPSIRKGVFNSKFDITRSPGTVANVAAAAVNLFYLTNVMHDISYQYGFTESAGNFQKDNFNKGGQGNDPVIITVLDTSDVDGAEFFTPPDGQPGEMNLYRYTNVTPNRSAGFDNTIIIHEYAHGISNRLTGGPAADSCLEKDESEGMGEGWSDIMALIVLAKSSDTATTEIPIGTYIANNADGIRFHPYTTNMQVNPQVYSDLKTLSDAHNIGEVWASMLWEVYWNLVFKHGFSTNLYDASQSEGNIVAMKIIIGGMMIQSCNPTFLDARDAIITADFNNYQGANKCEIYKGFAKRGLGLGATDTRTNDFSVPPECQ